MVNKTRAFIEFCIFVFELVQFNLSLVFSIETKEKKLKIEKILLELTCRIKDWQ